MSSISIGHTLVDRTGDQGDVQESATGVTSYLICLSTSAACRIYVEDVAHDIAVYVPHAVSALSHLDVDSH